ERPTITLRIFGTRAIGHYDSEIAEPRDEDPGQVPASRACREPIEESDPTLAGPRAVFMIAAHHNPRRCGEQRRCRLKEIRIPGVKSITPWAAGAAAMVRRTRQLAIMVVSNVDHQIRPRFRSCGGDFGKRPSDRIIAILLCSP